jgi:YegS/Rv2252/BmrU family lipid kinase
MPQAALVVNAGSRSGTDQADAAATELEAKGIDLGFRCACSGSELTKAVEEALKAGCSPIIVGGGDGTQSLAASVLKGTGVPQGILPLGTGNALARDLNIPTDMAGACDVIATGRSMNIDLGEVNDRIFVNLCSLGLTAEIESSLDSELKRTLGRAAYIGPVAKALENAKPINIVVKHDGGFEAFQTLLAACGPGGTQGGILPFPGRAGHKTGVLSFYSVRSVDLSSYAELLWHLSRGTWKEMTSLVHFESQNIEISTDPKEGVVVDGEAAFDTPIKIRCLPGALTVIAPVEA